MMIKKEMLEKAVRDLGKASYPNRQIYFYMTTVMREAIERGLVPGWEINKVNGKEYCAGLEVVMLPDVIGQLSLE